MKQQILTNNNESSSRSLRRFINSINSPRTEETYVNSIKLYMQYHNIKDFDSLLQIDKEKTFEMIEDFLEYLRKKQKRSLSRINTILCSIRLFYSVNRYDDLNWYILNRFKGKERKRMVKDRAYTRQDIHKLLDYADLRMKVAILVMASSGIRVEGLVLLKLKDLEYIQEYRLYRICVYSDSIDDTYYTFCTPECAQYIKLYFETRERQFGENLNPESPLIRKDFDNNLDLKLAPHSVGERIRRISLSAGIRMKREIKEGNDPIEVKRQRHEIMTCHGLRKFFDTVCIDSDMKNIPKEIMMGHKREQGLDRNYYRPTLDTLLKEYLKVVNDLTIDESNRLSKQIQELKEKNEDKDDIINGKLQEKESEIQIMKQQIQMLRESQKEILECLKYPERLTQIIKDKK
jgi:integrase